MPRTSVLLALLLAACAAPPAPAPKPAPAKTPVLTGLDVWVRAGFSALKSRRVGLICNHTSIDRRGRHALDLMAASTNVKLVAIFSPEHGIRGTADEKVRSGVDPKTGLPIHSLYGKTFRPTPKMLAGIDTLVFDIQDIGARFYTYVATLGYCMEEASKRGISVYVLDRPNPLGGTRFDGPIQDADLVGRLTSFQPMPITHGMTVGEIARLFNRSIQADLKVVRLEGWRRGVLFDETGLPWVNPSPNMRSLSEELLYPMVALVEANKQLSVGRGTDRPFEYVGAPWVDGARLAADLRARNLPGVWVQATTFVPAARDVSGRKNARYPWVGQVCRGVRLTVTDRQALRPVEAGVHLLSALLRVHPKRFRVDRLRGLVGARWVLDALRRGEQPAAIAARWRSSKEFKAFAAARQELLLYPERR